MPTVARWVNDRPQYFDTAGDPLALGKLYFYAANSVTPQNTYNDSTGGSANSNPVVLDAYGRPQVEIWLDVTLTYKAVLKSAADVTIWTEDDIQAINATSVDSQGTDITWGATVTIPSAGNFFDVAGSGTATAFTSVTSTAGRRVTFYFTTSVSATHSNSLQLQGAASYTFQVGDVASFRVNDSGQWLEESRREIPSRVRAGAKLALAYL